MQLIASIHEALGAVNVPNPPPKPIPGTEGKVSDLIGYVKWGALIVILTTGFGGVMAVAGGKVAGHHKSMTVGVWILGAAIFAAILWGAWFGFFNSLVG